MATVARDLTVPWRISTTGDDDLRYKFITPSVDDDEPRVTAPSTVEGAEPFPIEIFGVTQGAYVNPVITPLANQAAGLTEAPYEHIYYRIWVVPPSISVQNPALNTNIPFIVWSAWTISNTLNTIVTSGATGLTISLTPTTFLPVEQKTVNLQVTSAAPAVVHAVYTFNFVHGSGVFNFDAILLEWIKTIPEVPVVETWEWLSDIIRGWNSTEQRISIRRQPRRKMEYPILIGNDADRREWYDRFYTYLRTRVLVPFFQYHTIINQGSIVTATKIFFTPANTDFRDNDYAIIYRPSDDSSFIIQLSNVVADGANLASPLTTAVLADDLVAPAFFGRLENLSGIKMTSVAGEVQVGAFILDFRAQFNRPGSVAVQTTFDGLLVLERRPVVTRNAADEVMDTNPVIVDNRSGVYESKVAWLHTFVQGKRQFSIARRRNPTEMDFWRDFLTTIVGQRQSFLMPTYREDLKLSATPAAGANQILVEKASYTQNYFPYDTYKRLHLTNPSGSVEYRKVTASIAQPGDTSLLTIDPPLPVTADWAVGFRIAYLNRMRLVEDIVKLTHYGTYTLLDLAIRTTDQ